MELQDLENNRPPSLETSVLHKPAPYGLPIREPYEWMAHQVRTLQFMKERELEVVEGVRGGEIVLEMGLGKTLCVLGCVMYMAKKEPALFLVERTTQLEIVTEVFKFFGSHCPLLLYRNKRFHSPPASGGAYRLMICAYEDLLWMDKEASRDPQCAEAQALKARWSRIFMDECQRVSDPKTKTYKIIESLSPTASRFGLSGTPQANSANNAIWAQMKLCGYNQPYREAIWKQSQTLQKCMYRDTWADLQRRGEIQAPVLERRRVPLSLQDWELVLYRSLYDYIHTLNADPAVHSQRVLYGYRALVEACVTPGLLFHHVKLIQEWKPPVLPWFHLHDQIHLLHSTKLNHMVKIIQESQDAKIVVYVHWTHAVEWISRRLHLAQIPHTVLTSVSQVWPESWESALHRFRQTPSSTLRVLVMDAHASKGLNLSEVTEVIFMHAEEDLTVETQALYRSIRLRHGKKAPPRIRVWDLRIQGSIEETFSEMALQKYDKKQARMQST